MITLSTVEKIVSYMKRQGYRLFTEPHNVNIVYIEGMDIDGEVNTDEPNQFNDLRLLIDNNFRLLGNWVATTEPGRFYTLNPMNKKGAARIAFGQYEAWQIGTHGNSEPHEALVQVKPVKVYRDANKDFIRTNDALDSGLFGINQHWGYDLPETNLGKASAGCLVGRSRKGHREFMALIKSDIRYQKNKNFVFTTAIIPGDKL